MDEKLLTTYSLFSVLANGKTDIYKTVFVPICKRALSLYAQMGHTAGTDQDIKDVMLEEYGINAPTLIVRELINAAQRDLSRKNRSRFDFRVFNGDGSVSFQFNEYSFSEIDNEYDDQRRKANALQEAFGKFIEADGGKCDNIQPFAEFINKNQIRVSSFLSGKGGSFADSDETSFMPHVRFLKYIEQTNSGLYETTRQIFMGSIIAAYLEASVDLNAKLGKGVTYYLDTQIVLELLNELDAAILKSENVSSEEYEILVSAVARESSGNVFKMLDDAEKDPDKFDRDIHALIENERKKKNDAEKSYIEKVRENKDLQTDNEELRKQLSEISSQFEELSKREEQRRLEEKKRRKKINVFVIVLILCVVLFIVPFIFPKIDTVSKSVSEVR